MFFRIMEQEQEASSRQRRTFFGDIGKIAVKLGLIL
jgi:hypothetical protein